MEALLRGQGAHLKVKLFITGWLIFFLVNVSWVPYEVLFLCGTPMFLSTMCKGPVVALDAPLPQLSILYLFFGLVLLWSNFLPQWWILLPFDYSSLFLLWTILCPVIFFTTGKAFAFAFCLCSLRVLSLH